MGNNQTNWTTIILGAVALGAVAIIGTQMAGKFGEGFGKGFGEQWTGFVDKEKDQTIKIVVDMINGAKEQAEPYIDAGKKGAENAWDSSLPGQFWKSWQIFQGWVDPHKLNTYQEQMKSQAAAAMTGAGIWSKTPSQSPLLTPIGKVQAKVNDQVNTINKMMSQGNTMKNALELYTKVVEKQNQVTTQNADVKVTSQGGTGIYNNSMGKTITIDQMMPEDRITMDTKNDIAKYGAPSTKPASGPVVNQGEQIVSWIRENPTGGISVSDRPADGFRGVTMSELRKALGY